MLPQVYESVFPHTCRNIHSVQSVDGPFILLLLQAWHPAGDLVHFYCESNGCLPAPVFEAGSTICVQCQPGSISGPGKWQDFKIAAKVFLFLWHIEFLVALSWESHHYQCLVLCAISKCFSYHSCLSCEVHICCFSLGFHHFVYLIWF